MGVQVQHTVELLMDEERSEMGPLKNVHNEEKNPQFEKVKVEETEDMTKTNVEVDAEDDIDIDIEAEEDAEDDVDIEKVFR